MRLFSPSERRWKDSWRAVVTRFKLRDCLHQLSDRQLFKTDSESWGCWSVPTWVTGSLTGLSRCQQPAIVLLSSFTCWQCQYIDNHGSISFTCYLRISWSEKQFMGCPSVCRVSLCILSCRVVSTTNVLCIHQQTFFTLVVRMFHDKCVSASTRHNQCHFLTVRHICLSLNKSSSRLIMNGIWCLKTFPVRLK